MSGSAAVEAASADAAPRFPDIHLFDTDLGHHLLLVDGSRVFDIDADLRAAVEAVASRGRGAVAGLLAAHGLEDRPFIGDSPLKEPPLRALSLAIAQKCNLACTYCYAQEGSFGGPPTDMTAEVGRAAVRRLMADAKPGERVSLAFLGGEPLTRRPLLKELTELAAGLAAERGLSVGFSITTNGTLLRPEDADFFERYRFTVTVSIDGIGKAHDRQRPAKGGAGSYERILARLGPLLARGPRLPVHARVTVTPRNLDLQETLGGLLALGFTSVGFSPVLSAPSGRDTLAQSDFQLFLEQMIRCGAEFERRARRGLSYGFSNMTTALTEIHRGTHRPYPCGAGAGYLGVAADGRLYACHRFVDEPEAAMGSVDGGIDREVQARWLEERAVDRQSPCSTCWARYLCGGGCHHDVIHRGRASCDYIRGWLHYTLGAYVRLAGMMPDLLRDRPA